MSQQQPPGWRPPGQPPPPTYNYQPGYSNQPQPANPGGSRPVVWIVVAVLSLFLLGGVGGGAFLWYDAQQTERERQREATDKERERRRQEEDEAREKRRQAADDDREKRRRDDDETREKRRRDDAQRRRDSEVARAVNAENEQQRLAAVDAFNRSVLRCFHPTAGYTSGTLGAEYTDADGRKAANGHIEFTGGITGHGYSMDYVLHRKADAGDKLMRVTPGKDTAFTAPDPQCSLRQWSREN